MRTRIQVTIDRPVGDVFAFVGDPTNDPHWCPNVRSVEQVSGEGAAYAVVHDPMGKPEDLRYDILTYDPLRRLTMRQEDAHGVFVTTYVLEPAGPGRTRFVQASDMQFKGLKRLAAPLIAVLVRKGNRKQFARLKELLETSEGDGEPGGGT